VHKILCTGNASFSNTAQQVYNTLGNHNKGAGLYHLWLTSKLLKLVTLWWQPIRAGNLYRIQSYCHFKLYTELKTDYELFFLWTS